MTIYMTDPSIRTLDTRLRWALIVSTMYYRILLLELNASCASSLE